jgi:hypothetical protein
MIHLRSPLLPRPPLRCHPERSEGSAFRLPPTSSLDRRHGFPHLPPISVNSVLPALKSTFDPSAIPSDDSHPIAPTQTLPTLSTTLPLRAHSNARNPIPFRRLLHDSLNSRGSGSRLPAHHSPALSEVVGSLVFPACPEWRREGSHRATIPFRITSFAYPHPLTPIESYLCKKHRGRGRWHSQTIFHRAGFAR